MLDYIKLLCVTCSKEMDSRTSERDCDCFLFLVDLTLFVHYRMLTEVDHCGAMNDFSTQRPHPANEATRVGSAAIAVKTSVLPNEAGHGGSVEALHSVAMVFAWPKNAFEDLASGLLASGLFLTWKILCNNTLQVVSQ